MMKNWFDGLNEINAFIEANLENEIDYEVLGKIVGYSPYHLQRLFLMLTNVPISEYIRYRRLSNGAYDLLDGTNTVTAVAFKYGYSSPTSFSRAFKAFHGITPKDIKKSEHFMKAYPPLNFELSIKGASSIEYKLVKTASFKVMGKKIKTTMTNGQSYQEIPAFWKNTQRTTAIPELLSIMNREPYGVLGVSAYNPNLSDTNFDYYIGVATNSELTAGYDEIEVPPTTWAVFPHLMNTPAEMQEFQRKIVMDWLPTSGYQFAAGPDLEVYGEGNTMETWLPVCKLT